MRTEAEYLKQQKNANRQYALFALRYGNVRRDKKNRAYYIVPTTQRRSGQMLIQEATIKKFLKAGDIQQSHIDNIRPY